MRQSQSYQHWQLMADADGILWLTLNRQGASVNSINREVLTELAAILTGLADDLPAIPGLYPARRLCRLLGMKGENRDSPPCDPPSRSEEFPSPGTPGDLPVGIVILSGKAKGFIAGADIKQFTVIKTAEEAFDLVRQAQLVFDSLSQLPVPTVAMIRGFCLGGGLELALACRYRVAEDSPDTRIGLPEVKLGLHPGWGGTVRLPRLIGAPKALEMMLTGQALSAKKAAHWGVVDIAVPARHLEAAARDYILRQPSLHFPRGLARWSNAAWVRPWLGRWLKKQLAAKVQEAHYPAPFAIIHNWMRDGAQGERAMINEARSIAELMVGPTSRQLVRVFLLQDQLKALAKNAEFKPKHIHVIGAGVMGGDIAAWCAYRGLTVTLQDQTPQKIAPALERAQQLFTKKWEQPRLVRAAIDRLQPDVAGEGIAQADVVIEAVFEDLAVKREIFRSIESRLKPDAILATNTSSIPLQEIASALTQPSRLIGLHFFNPVAKMLLIEVVGQEQSDATMLRNAAAFVNQLGHYPLLVASRPGFLINRILMPYLLEAVILHEEGVPISVIDAVARDFGMPMGPIELADRVGLDICLSVANHLALYYGFTVPEQLTALVAEKNLGVKTGRGFYTYNRQGRPIIQKTAALSPPDLVDRLILRLCNEAVACWGEKIVVSADLIDAGMVYGAGFAPFRGGPMEYIRDTGAASLRERLQQLSERYGERFKPHPQWMEV